MTMVTIEQKIPVYIVNRNRLTTTKALVEWLRQTGTQSIRILDNASDYHPLLEWYGTLRDVTVCLLPNEGPMAFWFRKLHLQQTLPYVLTDSDCVPSDCCPSDLIGHLLLLLLQFPNCGKVGAGLRTGNIPDTATRKAEVLEWEKQWTQHRASGEAFYAKVDTTFALYPAYGKFTIDDGNLRTAWPYLVDHLPWHNDERCLTDEERYYWQHKDYDLTGWNIKRPEE